MQSKIRQKSHRCFCLKPLAQVIYPTARAVCWKQHVLHCTALVHVTLHTLSSTFPELYLELSETLTQPNYPNPSAEPIRRTQLFGARNIGRGRKTCWFQCQTIMALQHCYLSWWGWELEILAIVTVPWPEKIKGALKRYLSWKLYTHWNSKWLSVQQSLQLVPLLQALSEHAYSNMFEIVIVNQSGKLWQIRRCIFTCVILHYTNYLMALEFG